MIQNKTIHYWKLGRDELLLARRNPEIQEIKDHQKETNVRRCRYRMVQLFRTMLHANINNKTLTTTTYILFLLYINLTNANK